jgi:protein-L-isoaspartate(D-aspartate) O-methyltransferase
MRPRTNLAAYKTDVREAMKSVPRDKFVLPRDVHLAYGDHALPIGFGQTISQPSLVARMTYLLELRPGDRVLEIGTGSGYQTAVLAALGYVEIYTVEVIPELAAAARERLAGLGFSHIHFKLGDGYLGWPEHAPYDGIIVTAAPTHVPPPLLEQLADGAYLVIPVGPTGETQVLWRIRREGDDYIRQQVSAVAFVPLIHTDFGPPPVSDSEGLKDL